MQLQFGHACLRVETGWHRPSRRFARCFNSATPACAWRRQCPRHTGRPAVALQFGHACLRVETLIRNPIVPLTQDASIRPRLLARGDADDARDTNRQRVPLQFGHACLRVETSMLDGISDGWLVASIRPRLLARGDKFRFPDTFTIADGFNSATPACAWRRVGGAECRIIP